MVGLESTQNTNKNTLA